MVGSRLRTLVGRRCMPCILDLSTLPPASQHSRPLNSTTSPLKSGKDPHYFLTQPQIASRGKLVLHDEVTSAPMMKVASYISRSEYAAISQRTTVLNALHVVREDIRGDGTYQPMRRSLLTTKRASSCHNTDETTCDDSKQMVDHR